ncbi:MAG: hypothetical protein A2Z17_04655 [Gammaproteobacteria bacterium RBG_16_66_13]|nr:MAG: hypothetical protein A2Z17_04655 [Gammaproteobacteria bacterium RBG_16_66_13]
MSYLARGTTILVVAVVALLMFRFVITQRSIESIGLIESDNSVSWASLEPVLGASGRCVECHTDVDLEWSRSAHLVQSCEACHGAGGPHISEGAILGAAKEECIACHAAIPARPEDFPQVELTEHHPETDCTTCHNPHSPAAAFPDVQHRIEGRQDCLACHGEPDIGRLPPNHLDRAVETCLGCHKPGEGVEP